MIVDKLTPEQQELFWQFTDDMGVPFAMKYARACVYEAGKSKPHYPVPAIPIALVKPV